MSFQPDVEELKRMDLPDFLARRYGLHGVKQGRSFLYHCPFHQPDTKPSFVVSCKGGQWLWHDFHDGQGGDVIAWVARLEGLSMGEAIQRLKSGIRNQKGTQR